MIYTFRAVATVGIVTYETEVTECAESQQEAHDRASDRLLRGDPSWKKSLRLTLIDKSEEKQGASA